MSRSLLILNAGSSSLKFAVFRADSALERLVTGTLSRIGQENPELVLSGPGFPIVRRRSVRAGNPDQCMEVVLREIRPFIGRDELAAVGHRIVHGGRYDTPQWVDATLLKELRRLSWLDPEHLPREIGFIAALQARLPQLGQLACFDTAFHRDLPRVARLFPIPRHFEKEGIRRYGFHGLSYEFLLRELTRQGDPAAAQGRVILAHLGSGASLAAVRDGHCIDTSMGFTPAAGLPMGTRPGDLDPGLLTYLGKVEGMTPGRLQKMINEESGLLGISGSSSDMQDLLEREASDPHAADAVAFFCYQTRKWIGAYAAALGGVDTLVFSGGIGEHSPVVRSRICTGLRFLGIDVNETRNADNASVISADGGAVSVRVIPTDEEWVIAHSTLALLPAQAT
jgi:acetate kinase